MKNPETIFLMALVPEFSCDGGLLLEYFVVYIVGALGYGSLEFLYRGYTHWTMLITGGLCFTALYAIANSSMILVFQCVLGAVVITTIELLSGMIVNLWLGWDVWDYSSQPFNLNGQICLSFSLIWFALCCPAAYICRGMRKRFARRWS